MNYDFDRIYDRRENHSAKYDEMEVKFGSSDLKAMWIADMDFPTPQPVVDALVKRATQGIFGYTSRPESYFKAMQDWYATRYNWKIKTEWVSHSPSVVTSLGLLVDILTIPGDKIVIQPPVYNPFFDVIGDRSREIVENHLISSEEGYRIDFEDLDSKLSGAKLMILCNPHNPIGRVWKTEELIKIGDLCLKHHVRVISDEIHADFVYPGHQFTPFASLSDAVRNITATCLSASKTFNLAGLQASFVILPREEEKTAFDTVFSRLDIARNNCFSAVAAEAAFLHGSEWLSQLLAYLDGNIEYVRMFCAEHMPQIKPNRPEGTYLLWVDCTALGMTDSELSRFMIKEAGLALNSGAVYGLSGSGFVRMNMACSRVIITEAMNQLKQALALRATSNTHVSK